MARHIYQSTARDGSGRIIASANVTVYLEDGTTLATIYSAESGGSAVTNSRVTTASDGTFSFFVDDSDYAPTQKFKFSISKTGYTAITRDDVQIIPDDPYKYYANANEANQGVAGDGNTINSIIDAVGSKNVVIVLTNSGSGNTTNYVLSTAETAGANIYFEIEPGALIKPGAGISLTVYSPENIIASPRQQIVDTTNNSTNPLLWSKEGTIYPQWWGAVGDASTDDSTAVQVAADSLTNGGRLFLNSIFKIVTVGGIVIDAAENIHVEGTGYNSGLYMAGVASGGQGAILNFKKRYCSVQNIRVYSDLSSNTDTYTDNNADGPGGMTLVSDCTVDNVWVTDTYKEGVMFSNTVTAAAYPALVKYVGTIRNSYFENVNINGANFNGDFEGQVTGNTFIDCHRAFEGPGDGVTFANNTLWGCWYGVLMGNESSGKTGGSIVANNVMMGDTADSRPMRWGIEISVEAVSNGVTITGNYLRDIEQTGIRIKSGSDYTEGLQWINVSNNTIIDILGHASIASFQSAAILLNYQTYSLGTTPGTENWIISGNIIENTDYANNDQKYGIVLHYKLSLADWTSTHIEPVAPITVSNNHIRYMRVAAIIGMGDAWPQVNIKDNYVDGTGAYGIVIASDKFGAANRSSKGATGTVISGNTLKNINQYNLVTASHGNYSRGPIIISYLQSAIVRDNQIIEPEANVTFNVKMYDCEDTLLVNNPVFTSAGQLSSTLTPATGGTTIGTFHSYLYNQARVTSGTTAPVNGKNWLVGSIAWDTAPASGAQAGWVCTDRVTTEMKVAAVATDTILDVDDTTGMAAGDIIGIELDDGTWHWSTVASVTDGDTVVIDDAMPSGAAIDNDVITNEWKAMANLA